MQTYDYEFINSYNGRRSPTGRVEDDYTTAYFMRCLYQRAISVIDFDVPAEWNKQYFLNVLFRNGFISIIDSPKYGIIPQVCTLTGYGLYMQPTEILVSQPLVQFRGEIGKDCELIKLTPDYCGIWDIIEHYAVMMATCTTSIDISLVNSRLGLLALAKNKAAAETLKIVCEKLSAGEPLIVVDKVLGDSLDKTDSLFTQAFDVKGSYITDMLLDNMTTILNQFDREVGIPTVDAKKERMITGEVKNMTTDACSRLETWKTCLRESVDNVNNLFGIDIDFTTREEKVNEYNAENDIDRNV